MAAICSSAAIVQIGAQNTDKVQFLEVSSLLSLLQIQGLMRETMAVERFYIYSPGYGISQLQLCNKFETTYFDVDPNDLLGRFPLSSATL